MGDYMSCPKCGSPVIVKDFVKDEYECSNCEWNNYKNRLLNPEKPCSAPKPKKKENPYRDFAREMSMLQRALVDAGLGVSYKPILEKMSPIVWDKVMNYSYRISVYETSNSDDGGVPYVHTNGGSGRTI